MNNEKRTIDNILARLFVLALKIEERIIAQKAGGLTISELHVLREVGIGDRKTMTQVANGLMISVGALTTAMNKLELKGYVRRERDTIDRRVVFIELTESGRAAWEQHELFHEGLVEAAVGTLSEEERKTLLLSMQKLDDYMMALWADLDKK